MKRCIWFVLSVLTVAALWVTPLYANANDFTISKFEADYYLDRDKNGRSTLKTIERITAEFPQYDQNHGLERALPMTYDGHPTHLKIDTVHDASGQPLPYETRKDNDNVVLRIGDPDVYIHGSMTYVITYSQRDTTRYFPDTASDEFYWDINGTQWKQPFGEVTARLHLGYGLNSRLSGAMSCYYGYSGATDRCDVREEGNGIVATITNLRPGQNMTVAIGFKPNTFAAYELSVAERVMAALFWVWIIFLVASSLIGFILIFVLSYRYGASNNRKKELGAIIPEYIPPKNVSLLASAQIGEGTRTVLTAQIIDLAVRHYVKVYQTRQKALFKNAEYELEITKAIDSLTLEEQDFLKTLFGANGTGVGARLEMKTLKSDYKVAVKMQKDSKALEKRIWGEYGLRKKDARASRWFKKVGVWTLIIAIVTVSPLMLIAAIVAFVCGSQLRPLTDKGLKLRRYLAGLKLYISVAEEERLKILQSPEGAEKAGEAAQNAKKRVKLYEKVLPYAILFGQEKEWNKQLGIYYEQNGTSPDWYSGQAAFSAAAFSSAMNDFGSTTNSYAVSTSSSSGGSSGGGSSGGGGGGGGGGGW